jgi:hypothetical protein
MFRMIRGQGFYATVATADDIAHAIEHAKPGRYIVEEVSRAGELLPSGHPCRRWGTAMRDRGGHVSLDPEPWPECGAGAATEKAALRLAGLMFPPAAGCHAKRRRRSTRPGTRRLIPYGRAQRRSWRGAASAGKVKMVGRAGVEVEMPGPAARGSCRPG